MDNIHWDKDEAEGTIDASDLNFEPGAWPDQFINDARRYTKYSILRDTENEVLEVRYRGPNGRVVRVFND
jgi:hypothetical protein